MKPEMWDSPRLGKCSVLARLNFVGLISMADDHGRGRAYHRFLFGHLHPYATDVTEEAFKAALAELGSGDRPLVIFYQENGEEFYAIPGWHRHQYVEKAKGSALPPPPGHVPDEEGTPPLCGGDVEGNERGARPSQAGTSRLRIGLEGIGLDSRTAARPKFAPPTLSEVQAYCRERNNGVNPAKFWNHYQSNGWKVGKNPMKDWRCAVHTWEQSDPVAAPKPKVPEGPVLCEDCRKRPSRQRKGCPRDLCDECFDKGYAPVPKLPSAKRMPFRKSTTEDDALRKAAARDPEYRL